ncbi:hypothetical protein B0H14DRAFT_2571529 [Mycena olivaceomarginata]|nr:hypothetical protein B0H14DRAFT_2571529 [Mycena olivaceomarginata]
MAYDRYRGNLYRDKSTKLSTLIETIMSDRNGKQKLLQCMQPHLVEFACEPVADEMETRRKNPSSPELKLSHQLSWRRGISMKKSTTAPFLPQILETAAQTERAKAHNKKKKPGKICQVITQQLLYQSSNRCLAFQAAFGYFSGPQEVRGRPSMPHSMRAFRWIRFSMKHITSTADNCMIEAIDMSYKPHGFCYDNMNLSTSIFVEQREALGPAKVTSGTFGILYGLRNAWRCV